MSKNSIVTRVMCTMGRVNSKRICNPYMEVIYIHAYVKNRKYFSNKNITNFTFGIEELFFDHSVTYVTRDVQ